MPHLNDLNSRFAPRGLKIVAVSNETGDEIAAFIRQERVTYPVARAARAFADYGVRGIPHAFIVGRDGKVLWRGHPGSISDGMVEAWLGGGPMPPGAAPSASGGSSSWVLVFAIVVVIGAGLIGVVAGLFRRGSRPSQPINYGPAPYPQGPVYPPLPQQRAAPPSASTNACPHCGAPKREGRKNCMSCGAPY